MNNMSAAHMVWRGQPSESQNQPSPLLESGPTTHRIALPLVLSVPFILSSLTVTARGPRRLSGPRVSRLQWISIPPNCPTRPRHPAAAAPARLAPDTIPNPLAAPVQGSSHPPESGERAQGFEPPITSSRRQGTPALSPFLPVGFWHFPVRLLGPGLLRWRFRSEGAPNLFVSRSRWGFSSVSCSSSLPRLRGLRAASGDSGTRLRRRSGCSRQDEMSRGEGL